eukprot:CAMPEP_0183567296 /NCGR_PEP_ID=MMETSP0371-20130417/113918_1 /TAXON_ID=268820 /ORGANISM="Peridinium aciculiferum, Strain PAER-2" /LENGTH=266 /DNA_ID=CAMNT_0025776659 /DNA_START=65 /DNA_END=865 /DNA_ORIENTATION=+
MAAAAIVCSWQRSGAGAEVQDSRMRLPRVARRRRPSLDWVVRLGRGPAAGDAGEAVRRVSKGNLAGTLREDGLHLAARHRHIVQGDTLPGLGEVPEDPKAREARHHGRNLALGGLGERQACVHRVPAPVVAGGDRDLDDGLPAVPLQTVVREPHDAHAAAAVARGAVQGDEVQRRVQVVEVPVRASDGELYLAAVGRGHLGQVEFAGRCLEVPLRPVGARLQVQVLDLVGAVDVAVEKAPAEGLPRRHHRVDVAGDGPGVRAADKG